MIFEGVCFKIHTHTKDDSGNMKEKARKNDCLSVFGRRFLASFKIYLFIYMLFKPSEEHI